MKRSPMPRRKKPMEKGASLRRREGLTAKKQLARTKPIRRGLHPDSKAAHSFGVVEPVKAAPRKKYADQLPERVRAEVRERSGGWCEANWPGVCAPGRHRANHMHHVILRSQGGADESWNLLHLCSVVHTHAHDVDRAGAETRGIIRRRAAR